MQLSVSQCSESQTRKFDYKCIYHNFAKIDLQNNSQYSFKL